MTELDGTIVVVAGGAGEVGAGLVSAFLDAGAMVVVPSRNKTRLEDLRRYLNWPDPAALVTKETNIGVPDEAKRFRDDVLDEFGRIDAVGASLGGYRYGGFLSDMSLESWREMLENNLTTHFIVAQTFLPVLAETPADTSYTLITGSAGEAGKPDPQVGPVAVATAGVRMLRRALASECDARGWSVRVNEVMPHTPVDTRSRTRIEDDWVTDEDVGTVVAGVAADGSIQGETVRITDDRTITDWQERLSKG